MNISNVKLNIEVFFDQIFEFMHFLRKEHFPVSTGETLLAIQALEKLDIANEKEVYFGLRTALCSTHEERDRFERLFIAFFQGMRHQSAIREYKSELPTNLSDQSSEASKNQAKEEESTGTSLTDFTDERTAQKDRSMNMPQDQGDDREKSFLQAVKESQAASKQKTSLVISNENYAEMIQVARSLLQSTHLLLSRRSVNNPKGRRVDLRRTFRKSMGTGGNPIELARVGPRKHEARYVLICDGSRSMLAYTQLFLQFATALHREAQKTELFLFSTDVKRVTPWLTNYHPSWTLSFSELGQEWGGGTLIGKSLKHIINTYRSIVLSRQTVVILFSDGLESGEVADLEKALKQLKTFTHQLLWLNPLKGQPHYQPLARGMQVALPYIDVFAAGHPLSAFQQLPQLVRSQGVKDGS